MINKLFYGLIIKRFLQAARHLLNAARRRVASALRRTPTLRAGVQQAPVFLWVGVMASAGAWAQNVPTLTPEEQSYLASKPTVRMCVDPDWAPFERINEQGQHEGIAADLVQLVAQRVGLQIELLPVQSWDESLAASKAGRCEIMSFLNQTPTREQWLIFTAPIFFDPNIIIAREEHSYIGDLRGLSNKTVALPRGTMVEERIGREYPNLTPILTDSEQDAVALVSERKADITIRSLMVAAYAIKKEGLFNLKIAGQVPDFTNQLRMGVLKDETVLRDILDKGVHTLTAQERETIANRHVSIQFQQGVDYRLAWQILAASVLVLVVFLLWLRKLRSLNQRLEKLSVTDRLTGLYNRLKLDEVLASEVMRAARSGQPFSVVLIDIDRFKQVNDQHGHQAGDQVLVEFAQLLRQGIRATDVLGRWGGEEFLIVCPHTDAAGATQLAEVLRLAVQTHRFPLVDKRTASFGVAAYRQADSVEDMVSRADLALYAAKTAGRNRVQTAD
jgi:diguanylate cyclase (GGDEF)-like protein